MSNNIKNFLLSQKRKDLPAFRVGDVIKVYQKIEEGDKKRIQPFEGLVIAKKHGNEMGATFTVRNRISGIGTEKIFPVHSPTIKKIKIIKKAQRVTSAKLYWTRKKTDREIQKRLRLEQQTEKTSIKAEKAAKKETRRKT